MAALTDRYLIERELGAGGMATVYLAHDVRHDRKVAIKVLKPELAAVLGAERFVQEIKTTAALSHPHILPLFDSGEADGFLYYVMPYLQGETIREKLNRETQFGIEEAVKIATEVAEALDYAHRHGVIHRDIKPENILLHAGRPMVMDFGIALAVSAAAGGRMTETGLSLGTPHYMSPEQATADKDITARSDIYSLASVLYEMLAGVPPHEGGSAQQVIMRIIADVPRPVTDLRRTVPPNVSAALAKALEKLPADRFETSNAFAAALADPYFGPARARVPAAGPLWHRYTIPLLAVLGVTTVISLTLALRSRAAGDATVARFALALPATERVVAPGGTRFVWAPDGQSFVYVGTGGSGSQLWRRSLDALSSVPVPGTEGATSPFLSPDGKRIGFITLVPFALRLVSLDGGNPQLVTQERISGGGAQWADDGFIYFDGVTGIDRIRPDGTGRETVYSPDPAQREAGVAWPEVLPGAKAVLFRVRRSGDAIGDYRVHVKDLRTGATKTLVQAVVARFAPPAHLLYITKDGTLTASRFDLNRMELIGESVVMARGVGIGGFGVADLAISSRGWAIYSTDNNTTIGQPTWVTRAGAATAVDPAWPNGLTNSISLSPDGTQMAVEFIGSSASSSVSDIWTRRVEGGSLTRLTLGPNNVRPSWTADGRDVVYMSETGGIWQLKRQRADGSTPAQPVGSIGQSLGEAVLSPDGAWVVVRTADSDCCDLLARRLTGDTTPVPIATTEFRERGAALSRDGHWLAYVSDETGQFEVFVRPFPEVATGKWRVSMAGGSSPRWSRDELFFRDGAGDMQAVRFTTMPTFAIVGRERLFNASNYFESPWTQSYDVTPDGKRFIMLRVSDSAAGGVSPVLVQNFLAELRRLLP